MKVIHSVFNYTADKKSYVTIGTFDGVHIGHQKIIKELVSKAKSNNKKSVVLTFFPHPRSVIQQGAAIKLINSINERIERLKKLGLDCLIIHPFDKEFSKLTALSFVKNILLNQLKIDKLIIGYNHQFGKNREGSAEQLIKYAYLYNFKIEKISAQNIEEVSVSSTKIRNALLSGGLKTANKYLGYNFSLTGKIISGKQLGSKIGFPTANICLEESYKLIPKCGVYVVKSYIDNQTFYGMMNIGNRPTVKGTNQTIEVHFFNFNFNIYNKKITVELLCFLRDEQKFSSIEELKTQLKKDWGNSHIFLKNYANN
ncbi:MAG: bifunctional riboflavin kinase/FAD synthetase [Tenacibaculum sp.]